MSAIILYEEVEEVTKSVDEAVPVDETVATQNKGVAVGKATS